MDETNPHPSFAPHDHEACQTHALAEAETLLEQQSARLTPVRRRTLEILLEAHRAMGAYEVLERLAEDGFGKQPPVAYRALEFLVEHGLAHRLQRLNAFIACLHPGEDHAPVFLICRACKAVAESSAPEMRSALAASAAAQGFAIERATIEASGLCPGCQSQAPA